MAHVGDRPAARPDTPPFFTIRHLQTGGAIYAEIALFLGEAALAGVVGNAIYDAVRATLRSIATRWHARQESGEPPRLTRDEASELTHAAVRLRLTLAPAIDLITEELTEESDTGAWRGVVRNADNGERYRVHLSPDPDQPKVTVLLTLG
jgi:hypothetical protein